MNRMTTTALSALLALGVALPALSGEITVYTAYEEDEIAAYVAGAEAAIPDLKIHVLRLSTGDLAARMIAEAGNPQADMLWGQAITATMDPQIMDQLEPYEAAGADTLDSRFRDPENRWFAPTGYMGTFCINEPRMEAKGLPIPKSWKDLADPIYKGEIEMPDPTSSGTGWLHIISLLQGSWGEEEGWKMLDAVDPNMAEYTQSGSKPCKDARTGEFAIGISLGITGVQSVEAGYPVTLVFPEEGTGYELEAAGMFKTSKNKEDVKRFMDWLLTPEAVALYEQYKILITAPGATVSETAQAAGLPADLGSILADIDFAKAAADTPRISEEWTERYSR